ELLEFMQLKERSKDKVDELSGGMKRRLTIARALINSPELLLLDEPTTGLDPQARHLVWDRLYRLKQRGVTLVLTTHYMDEAEQLCDRLVVMDKARIAAEGSPRELIDKYSTREVLELRFPIDQQSVLDGKLNDVVEYNALVFRRIWRGSIAVSFFTPLFFLAAMGIGLGSLVNRSSGGVNGVPYLEFLAPGLIAAACMQTAAVEATYPILAKIMWD